MAPVRVEVSREGTEPETLDGEFVVGTLFPVLGLQPAIGRLIDPHDAAVGAAPVAVVSWSYWKSRFNLDPKVVGATIKIGGAAATIVGVTPRAFIGLQPGVMPSIWMPVTHPMGLRLMARLKPGVPIEQARAEMAVLQRPRLEELARKSGDPHWLQSRTDLEPAERRLLRSARPLRTALADPDGRRRPHPADRVHQCREPGAGARRGTAA